MRRFFRFLIIITLLIGGSVYAFGAAFLQTAPAVAAMQPPAPEDVRAAREFYKQVQAATNGGPRAPETVVLTAGTLESVLRLGARLVRDYRADTEITDTAVRVRASIPVAWLGQSRWINLRLSIPAFEDRFELGFVQLGEREIPAALALRLARIGGNFVLGSGAGDTLFDAPAAMMIDQDRMIFALRLDRDGRSEVIEGVFGTLRGSDMPAPELVDAYYVRLRDALERQEVPDVGSVLPLMRFAVEQAYEGGSQPSAANEFTAAILALAKACSTVEFRLIVGPLAGQVSEELGEWRTNCRQLTLDGRVDLRLHFVTAAAIKAASSRGFTVSLGEFKELHDSITGSGGFDFTDIVGNNSGIRFASLFMSSTREDWPALLARMQDEAAILPSLDGIPGLMPRDQFEARFGTIETPEYQAMIREIEQRIDRLALHAPSHGG